MAPSQALAAPGDWRAASLHGLPLLLARDKRDGVLCAFLNVCRHRGAALAAEGDSGHDRDRFICPYHSWCYGSDGRFVGRPHDTDFVHAPPQASALVPLPCTERFGMVWVVPTPGIPFDWPAYFGTLGNEVESLGFSNGSHAPHQRQFEQPCNWKLVFDANLECYHVAYAHRQTIAHLFHDNVVIHDQLGEHQRIVLPTRAFAELLPAPPATLQGFARAAHIIFFFFPCTLMLWEGDHINAFSISPLQPGTCRVSGSMLVPPEFARRRAPEYWQANFDIFWNAIDEDFALAASMQRGLASGANEALCFGAAEFACAAFHGSVERMLQRSVTLAA